MSEDYESEDWFVAQKAMIDQFEAFRREMMGAVRRFTTTSLFLALTCIVTTAVVVVKGL